MREDQFEFEWVTCDGGPLLVVEKENLFSWEGSDAPRNERIVEADFRWGLDVATDYDRACDVEESIGSIDVGKGQGIVLGSEPNPTTWLKLSEDDGFLVRWGFAENESSVIKIAKSLSDQPAKEEDLEFSVKDSVLILLAACESGDDKIYPRLKFSLSSGTYKIFTVEYKDEQTYVNCHRLRKKI